MPFGVPQRARLTRLLACGAVAGVLLAGGLGSAFAGDDEDEAGDTLDTRIFRQLLSGLGLKRFEGPGIDYHERSPLVVPPTRDLPPPGSEAKIAPDPAWPNDADVNRTAKRQKKAIQPITSEEAEMRQLRPDELPGTKPDPRRAQQPQQTEGGLSALSPAKLGFKGFGDIFGEKEETVPFTGEPQRTDLTQPPAGLRTPSPNYAYGTKGGLEPIKENDDKQSVGPNQ